MSADVDMRNEEVDVSKIATAFLKESTNMMVVDGPNVERVGNRRWNIRRCHILP